MREPRTKLHPDNYYRIIKADHCTVKFAGTGEASCFIDFEKAKELVDYSEGEAIYETDGMRLIHEVL